MTILPKHSAPQATKSDLETLTLEVESLKRRRTYLSDFPVNPNELDDIGRFQRAIAATPVGGELVIPEGYYFADSLQINKNISVIFQGHATIEATRPNRDILTIIGSRDEQNYVLAKPAKRGDRILYFQETPCVKPGDIVILTDDTVRRSDKQTDMNTEIHEVEQVTESGIILRDFVRLPKSISKLGINLYKIHPLENVEVKNFNFVMKPGSTRGTGLILKYVRGALITKTHGTRGAGSGIQVQKSIYIQVQGFQFVKPQVTGSGQGYGVQFYGGCSAVTIKDGYTLDCRHAVDLDSTYDAYVENVFDYNSQGAAFVMSHNGCCSDITFHNCQTLQSIGTGFVADSQGFMNRLDCMFYNFNITSCTVVSQSKVTAAVYWYSPCKNCIVRDCNLRYDSGEGDDFSLLSNAGIRAYPALTDLLISGCDIRGFRRGVALQVAGNLQLENDQSKITVRDTTITNCEAVIYYQQGKHRRLALYNLDCQKIHQHLFEFSGIGWFEELVIDGLTLLQSEKCQFCNDHKSFALANTPLQGTIHNLRSDLPTGYEAKSNWEINHTELYLIGDGTSFYLHGTGAVSGIKPLPDGLVEGQKLTLVTTGGKWRIHRGPNMLYLDHKQEIILDHCKRALSLIWRDGKWIEI